MFAGVAAGVCPSPDTATLNIRTSSDFQESSGASSFLRPGTGAPRIPIRLAVVLQKFSQTCSPVLKPECARLGHSNVQSASVFELSRVLGCKSVAAPEDGRTPSPIRFAVVFQKFSPDVLASDATGVCPSPDTATLSIRTSSGFRSLQAQNRCCARGRAHSVSQANTAVRNRPGNARCPKAIPCRQPLVRP